MAAQNKLPEPKKKVQAGTPIKHWFAKTTTKWIFIIFAVLLSVYALLTILGKGTSGIERILYLYIGLAFGQLANISDFFNKKK